MSNSSFAGLDYQRQKSARMVPINALLGERKHFGCHRKTAGEPAGYQRRILSYVP
ncbi:hypothetical protein KCP75_24945 [Salmonella enterica subsp. enterica]|nr:hypothetical protein KCP75_24945 [Salmonella enterica subsp. enterica]